jgi:hypothetical protein
VAVAEVYAEKSTETDWPSLAGMMATVSLGHPEPRNVGVPNVKTGSGFGVGAGVGLGVGAGVGLGVGLGVANIAGEISEADTTAAAARRARRCLRAIVIAGVAFPIA